MGGGGGAGVCAHRSAGGRADRGPLLSHQRAAAGVDRAAGLGVAHDLPGRRGRAGARTDRSLLRWAGHLRRGVRERRSRAERGQHVPALAGPVAGRAAGGRQRAVSCASAPRSRRPCRRYGRSGYELPAINDQGDPTVSMFARKAPYHYGWDWGPRFVTSGIWRPVRLELWDGARIDDVQVIQRELNDERAVLDLVLTIEATRAMHRPGGGLDRGSRRGGGRSGPGGRGPAAVARREPGAADRCTIARPRALVAERAGRAAPVPVAAALDGDRGRATRPTRGSACARCRWSTSATPRARASPSR